MDIQKKIRILAAKHADKIRFEKRVLETNRLQFSSNQMINIWDDDEEKLQRISVNDLEIKKMLAKRGLKIQNRDLQVHEWNNYTRIPAKTVEIIANDKIVKNDEIAVKLIDQKIKSERNFDLVKKELNLLKREKLMEKLKKKHWKNFEAEQKIIGKLRPPPPQEPEGQDFPLKFYDKEALVKFYQKKLNKHELFDRLSIPKEFKEPDNPLDYKEFRGLFIGDIDERTATQTENPLIKKLQRSEVLTKNIERIRSSRPQSTQSRRPLTSKSVFGMNYEVMPEQKLRELEILTKTFSDFNHEKLFEDREMIEKQINEFDEKVKDYKKVNPRVGYSQMKLQEAYDLSTTKGYFKWRDEKKINEFEANLKKERCKFNK